MSSNNEVGLFESFARVFLAIMRERFSFNEIVIFDWLIDVIFGAQKYDRIKEYTPKNQKNLIDLFSGQYGFNEHSKKTQENT